MAISIAVVIPAYNSARYIEETLKSVLAQTLPATEIVLADGASTDDTVAIARSVAADIKIICRPNAGAADGRNIALGEASADWLAFMDSDDLWHPDKLRLQAQLVERAPEVEFVFADVWQFQNGDVLSESFLTTRPGYSRLPKHSVGEGLYVFDTDMGVALMHSNYAVTSSTVMVKRSAALEAGCFDPTLRACEDYDFWIRLLKGRKAGVAEIPLVGYRHHGKSLSDNLEAMVRGRIEVSEKALAHPERYPEGAAEFFYGEKARRYAELGRLQLASGHSREARRSFWQSLRLAPKLSTAALMGGAMAGPATGVLVALKRALKIRI